MRHTYLTLCLVTNFQQQSFAEYKSFIIQAVEGGVTSVQWRDKLSSKSEVYQRALELKQALLPYNVPLILNDHLDIAKEIEADGVHLGQSDASPTEARKLLGENKIIGLSIESLAQLDNANQLDCIDYVAASAIFITNTKPDCKKIWGLDGLREFTKMSKHPVIAIGGIDKTNIKSVVEHGANGIAIVSAIHNHPDPKQAARELINEYH